MKVTIEKKDNISIITINGRLDTINSPEFEKQIQPVLEKHSPEIILDCNGLTYISSSGLRQFLQIRKYLGINGGKATIINLQEDILQVFKLTGFDELFEIK